MAFIPVPETAQFNIRCTLQGERVENTLYFRHAGGWSSEFLGITAELLADWYTTGPRSIMTSQLVLREVYAADLSSENGEVYTHAVANDPGGPETVPPLPNNVALCVSFRTGLRGRSYRGRNYVCGWTENVVNGNAVTAAAAATVQTAYNQLLNLGGSGQLQWVVVSRYADGQPRVTGVATPVLTAVIVDLIVDSQRRRLPGRGA